MSGFVQNDTNGIFIDVEGRHDLIDEFLDCLIKSPPPHAIIVDIHSMIVCWLYHSENSRERADRDDHPA
ncbi:MAG: acylphosphatase [Candidatus Brocadia sp.]|nr:acylphosphatase [Candidatus Brocadia sp.]